MNWPSCNKERGSCMCESGDKERECDREGEGEEREYMKDGERKGGKGSV